MNGGKFLVFYHGLAFSTLIFFSIVLSKSICISAFGRSSCLSNSFVILLFVRFFLVVGMFSCHLRLHLLVFVKKFFTLALS